MTLFTALLRDKGLCTLFLAFSISFCANAQWSIDKPEQLKDAINFSQSLKQSALIDRSNFINNSRLSRVSISPTSDFLSYMIKEGREQQKLASLWLFDIKLNKHNKLFSFKDIQRTYWSKNGEHLFLKLSYGVAVSNIKSTSNTPRRLVSLRAKKKERFLGIDYSKSSSFLVKLWNDKNKHFDIVSIDAAGNRKMLYSTAKQFISAETHLETGELALITKLNQEDNNKGEILFFDVSQEQERLVWQCQWDDECSVINYDQDNQTLTLVSNINSNYLRPVQIDLNTKQITELHADPKRFGDIAYLQSTLHDYHFSPALASYHGNFVANYALDKANADHLSVLKAKLDTDQFSIEIPLFDKPDSTWLIADLNNRLSVPIYYLFNKKNQHLKPVLTDIQQRADKNVSLLSANDIAPKFAFSYLARDGFQLQGYLTLPRGIDIKTAPLVVDVHGGPWSRTEGGYSKAIQFLANRGYIVFQPNFRASTGLGKAYKFGTKQDFGDGITQNDIVDGTLFLLNNGVGDSNRVAITGHSFGGFSVLAGLSFTPNLFKVGFAGAPPSNVARSAKYYWRFKEKVGREHNEYFMKQTVVDWDDPAALDAHYQNTPDNNLERIKAPLVMWAGRFDRRVFIADVKDYASRLAEHNKQVTLFVDPKALHSPRGKQGLLAYLYLKEKALSQYLGGPLQALDKNKDKALVRFIEKNTLLEHTP